MGARLALLLVLVLAALGAASLLWERRDERRENLERLGARRAALRRQLDELGARDPSLTGVPAGNIAIGISSRLASDLVREVTTRLLDRVVIQLAGIRVRAQGDVKAKLLLARVKAGTWHLEVTLDRIRAVLRPGEPDMDFGRGEDRIGVEFPVRVEEGSGEAAIRFRWDSSGLANVVCKDFELNMNADGSAVPDSYRLRGNFRIAADGEAITVLPEFADPTLRIRVRPSATTWAQARRAIESQDTFWRCGIGLRPDQVMEKLEELIGRGFDVRLPDKLFREIRLPAAFRRSLEIADREVELTVSPEQLSLTPRTLWYGADVSARLAGPPTR